VEVKDVVLLLLVMAWRKPDSVLTTMLRGLAEFPLVVSPVMGVTAPCWSRRSRSLPGARAVPSEL
jgi:hypothetical protein